MERSKIEEAFLVLKPLCDALVSNPSVENASKVAESVEKCSDAVIQDLMEYILCPITIHLQNNRLKSDVKESMIRTMRVVIQKTRVKRVKYFVKLHAYLLIQIYDKDQPNMVRKFHEELKEATLLCLADLTRRCYTEVIEELYVKDHIPKIGQGLMLSVIIARTEKSRHVKLAAIKAIMALCQIHDESDESDVVLRSQVADAIASYLPGIARALVEVATGSEVQGHEVPTLAIRAWGRLISLVTRDTAESEEDVLPTISPAQTSEKVKDEEILKTGVRNRQWFEGVSAKLSVLIRELEAARRHSHYKVRRELVRSVGLIIETSSRNMKRNLTELLDYVISLSEDENENVRNDARETLDRINASFNLRQDVKPLIELLGENFYELLTKLPRIIRRSVDAEQLSCLNQVAGYLRILGERLNDIVASTAHLRRLILALVLVSTIDYTNVSLLEDVGIKDLEDSVDLHVLNSWRRLKFIRNSNCEEKIVAICEFLGKHGDFRTLMDEIFALMFEMPRHRKELILLFNWIMKARNPSIASLYEELVKVYTNDELWYLPIRVTDDVPLRTAQNNIIQCCLLTEGLGIIGENLKTDHERFLLKTLYLLVERAGSRHGVISYVGIRTLEEIAKFQGYGSIANLLRANTDYFSFHVTVKLRRVERNPGVLDVVGIVMKYSTTDMWPCLKEIVTDVLTQLDATFQKKNSYALLKVLYIFVVCVKELIRADTQQTNSETPTKQDDTPIACDSENVIRSLIEHYEARKRLDEALKDNPKDSFVDELAYKSTEDEKEAETEEQPEVDNVDYADTEETRDLPVYVKMLEQAMKRCLHFLPSKETDTSLMAMDTLREGLRILSEWEDQLLPIVHLLWHALVDRFKNKNPIIVNRAWQLLYVLAYVSKDFIRSRTLKDVLPSLSSFLNDSAKESLGKDMGHMYRFTQTYKLQKELLSVLGEVARELKVHEKDLWKILCISEQYLNARQHPTLQACCVKLYKDIADYNGDIAWVKCLGIWDSKVSHIASDAKFDMKDLKVPNLQFPNEYRENVEKLIMYIQEKNENAH